jgi:hypothetical protein
MFKGSPSIGIHFNIFGSFFKSPSYGMATISCVEFVLFAGFVATFRHDKSKGGHILPIAQWVGKKSPSCLPQPSAAQTMSMIRSEFFLIDFFTLLTYY